MRSIKEPWKKKEKNPKTWGFKILSYKLKYLDFVIMYKHL